jgi:hypothetical protein
MRKFIAALCLIPSLIWGATFESNQMQDVMFHVEDETWVLIDVDNTLIESCVDLGSAQWRGHIRKKAKEAGFNQQESEAILDQFWMFVQPLIPVQSVDPGTPALLSSLHQSHVAVFALTARDCEENKHTQKQLDSAAIRLKNEFPEHLSLKTPFPSLFERGVIYCGENTKGQTLAALFEAVGHEPKKIIFIDDRWDQVKSVETEIEKLGIAFVGIRFNRADAHVKAFDPDVADLQFSLLPKIISNQEAKKLLN